jgi:hypothetical protein
MPSSADNSQTGQNSGPDFWLSFWPSIVRIIILEIVLLLALAGALVFYLNWSSEAAVSEFMATGSSPLGAIKVHQPCRHSGVDLTFATHLTADT